MLDLNNKLISQFIAWLCLVYAWPMYKKAYKTCFILRLIEIIFRTAIVQIILNYFFQK